ncbi:MAG TPA: TetR family transcriptional regulator C-terminal domain-containing protein [Selenomonadales bacterium]|nr:TetR family transcriptional regulator C-terminal domain-containing protein [Selenomonadales bacterium]
MKNQTREELIKAGASAMLAKSYHAVGIQEILAEANVPKGSFYHYFASKEDFGIAIIEYYGAQLANSIQTKLSDRTLPPRQRLIAYFTAIKSYYANNGCGQGCLVAKLATEIGDSSPRMRAALRAEFDRWSRLFADCIAEAQQKGDISPDQSPEALAEFLYASWEGALIRMQVNRDLGPIDNFMKYIFEYLIPGQ